MTASNHDHPQENEGMLHSTTKQMGADLEAQVNNLNSTVNVLRRQADERTAELERLAEEHNGFLFGEVPLPEGQSRQWQDWEYSYTPLMLSAFAIYGVAYYYR